MKANELILRCYGEKIGDTWQAFCIDLNLAAQGDSFPEVKAKLNQQIYSYVYDALVGEDKEYADQLLPRKSPLGFRIKYHYYKIVCDANDAKQNICRVFNEAMPLTPSPCNA